MTIKRHKQLNTTQNYLEETQDNHKGGEVVGPLWAQGPIDSESVHSGNCRFFASWAKVNTTAPNLSFVWSCSSNFQSICVFLQQSQLSCVKRPSLQQWNTSLTLLHCPCTSSCFVSSLKFTMVVFAQRQLISHLVKFKRPTMQSLSVYVFKGHWLILKWVNWLDPANTYITCSTFRCPFTTKLYTPSDFVLVHSSVNSLWSNFLKCNPSRWTRE